MELIIERLKKEARASWKGETCEIGEQRAENLEKYLRSKLKEYSIVLDIPQEEILKSWEEQRNYSVINYYQECNQPSIKSNKTKVFDTTDDLLKSIGEKKFRCPSCGEISTNPYECNCGWKVYGLLGDLGKGIFVFVKEKLKGETIFMPVSWEKKDD